MTPKYSHVSVVQTTDQTLPAFDNSRLVALNTCPTDGIIRYTYNKRMGHGGRAMALEAGSAAHEVFAAHRLHHFDPTGPAGDRYGHDRANLIFTNTGRRVFGLERFQQMVGAVDPREDRRSQRIAFSLNALYTSGFYDDPADRKRTVTNIEEMCIAYMDKFDWSNQMPIVLENYDASGPTAGIEIPIDVTLEYTVPAEPPRYADDDGAHHDRPPTILRYRFIGRADGVHWKDSSETVIRAHENKTASRLGDAWEQSHTMSHQHTGYMIGLSTQLGKSVRDTLVLGTALPLPTSYALTGISRVPVHREDFEIQSWFDWFIHTVTLHDEYADRPADAPHYTHSCNRYFRPCSYIPFCASLPEDRMELLEEMETVVWNPLDEEGSSD